jgi:hypothetical protein
VVEVFKRSQIEAGGSFNFTPYVAVRAHLPGTDDPDGALRRLVRRSYRRRQMATLAR